MKISPSGKSANWQHYLLTVLILAVFSACASSSSKNPQRPKQKYERAILEGKEKTPKPSLFKKATDFFKPVPTAPPLLPYQRDLKAAQYRYNLQEYPEAEFYLKKTFLQFPDEPSALKLLPWTYFYQKRYDKALLAFERHLTVDPRNAAAHAGAGWCYLSMNNYRQALDAFAQAEKFAPGGFFDIHKGRAIIYLKQKSPKKALPSLNEIYNSREVDKLLAFWESEGDKLAESSYPVLPENSVATSLFTLPVDGPRYLSMLWGLDRPGKKLPELETAWRYYRLGLYRRALTAFQNLPEPLNQTLDAQNGLAWSYLKVKEIQKADQVLNRVAQSYPKFLGVMNGMRESENFKMQKAAFAQYYLDLNKLKIAESKFEALKKDFPAWAYSYVQLGRIALKNNDPETARPLFLKAEVLAPKDTAVIAGMEELETALDPELHAANQALKNEKYKVAARLYHDYIEYHKPSLERSSSLARAYNGLGWSQYYKGQYQLAIEKFKQSREHPNFKSDSFRGMGLSYFQLKNYKDAATHLKFVLDSYPDKKQGYHELDWSVLQSWGDIQARQYFERELLTAPLRASLYMGMGWIHYKSNKPDLAVEYFLKAISLDPDSAVSDEFFNLLGSQRFGWQVYNHLGWAYYHKRKFAQALAMFQISLKKNPDNAEGHKGLGYNFYQMKNYASAIKHLKQNLIINPAPAPVMETVLDTESQDSLKIQTTPRTKLARAYYRSGNYLKAIDYYQKGLNYHPGLADAYAGLGWAYLKLRRLTESRAAFTESVKLEPLKTRSHKGLKEVKQLLATRNIHIKKPTFQKTSETSPPPK